MHVVVKSEEVDEHRIRSRGIKELALPSAGEKIDWYPTSKQATFQPFNVPKLVGLAQTLLKGTITIQYISAPSKLELIAQHFTSLSDY